MTASAAFSAPVATSVHGARYANAVIPVPTTKICNLLHTLRRGIEKFGARNGLTYPDSIGTYSEAYNSDRLTKANGNRFRFATAEYRLQTVSHKCQNIKRLVQPLDKLANEWFNDTPTGRTALRELEALKRAQSLRNKRFIITAVKLVTAIIFLISHAVTLSQHFSTRQIEANHRKALANNDMLLADGSIVSGQSFDRIAEIIEGVQWQLQGEDDATRGFARIDLSLDIIDDAVSTATRYLDATTTGSFPMEALLQVDLGHLAGMLEIQMHREQAQVIALRPSDLASSLGSFVEREYGFDLVLSVPMGTPASTMTVRRLTNVGTTLADGARVRIRMPSFQYIAISLDEAYWIALSATDFHACRSISGTKVCDELTVLHKTPTRQFLADYEGKSEEYCLYGLYSSDPSLIVKACEVTEVGSVESVIRTQKSSVVITSGKPTNRAQVSCPDPGKGGHIRLSPVTAVKIAANCTLETQSHFFAPASSGFLAELGPISNMWPQELSEAIFDDLVEEKTNNSQRQLLTSLRSNAAKLQAIGTQVRNNTITARQYATNHSQAISNSIVIILIIAVGLGIYAWTRIKQRYASWRQALPLTSAATLTAQPGPQAAHLQLHTSGQPQPLQHTNPLAISYHTPGIRTDNAPIVTFPSQ